MDYANLIVNFAAILAGLFMYLFIVNSKWGKKHEDIQYAIMLFCLLFAVLVGGLIRWLL